MQSLSEHIRKLATFVGAPKSVEQALAVVKKFVPSWDGNPATLGEAVKDIPASAYDEFSDAFKELQEATTQERELSGKPVEFGPHGLSREAKITAPLAAAFAILMSASPAWAQAIEKLQKTVAPSAHVAPSRAESLTLEKVLSSGDEKAFMNNLRRLIVTEYRGRAFVPANFLKENPKVVQVAEGKFKMSQEELEGRLNLTADHLNKGVL